MQKRVRSEMKRFRARNAMEKAEAHLTSALISFPILTLNEMQPSRVTVPFPGSDHI